MTIRTMGDLRQWVELNGHLSDDLPVQVGGFDDQDVEIDVDMYRSSRVVEINPVIDDEDE